MLFYRLVRSFRLTLCGELSRVPDACTRSVKATPEPRPVLRGKALFLSVLLVDKDSLVRLADGGELNLQCAGEILVVVDHEENVISVPLHAFSANRCHICGDCTSAAAPMDGQLKICFFFVAESFRLLRGKKSHKKSEQNNFLHPI